jgi:Kef-type K+ transport system membrane component KefB
MNPTAIESHIKLVLIQWTVIVVAAWAFGRLAKRLHQPLAVGEILAGILLGPSALGLIWPTDWPPLFPQETQQSLQLLGKIGLIFLLFQVGMEFDFGHLKTRSRTVLAVSVLGMVTPFAAGLAVGPWLHRTFAPDLPSFGFGLFFCIALSISALPIMGRMLLEWGLERTPLAAMAISSAALDDVTGWVLLAVASALVTAAFDTTALLLQVGGLLLFVLLLQKWWGRGSPRDGAAPRPTGLRTPCPRATWCCCWPPCSGAAWSPTDWGCSASSARSCWAWPCTRNTASFAPGAIASPISCWWRWCPSFSPTPA